MTISLDGYGSKIRKVSRCRPTVSNETILATKQEFFFTKVAPVQSITDIVLLGFWLILLPWMFISSYTTIYFFCKEFFFRMFIFQCIRYSIVLICFGWEIGHPLSTYTGKTTVISPNFLVWKFCGKAQFPRSFGRFARNFAETLSFRKISTPGNQVKLWYFLQCTQLAEWRGSSKTCTYAYWGRGVEQLFIRYVRTR